MTTATQHQIFATQIADDLAQATRMLAEVHAAIDNATDRALEAIRDGLDGNEARANAGRIAMLNTDRATDYAGQIQAMVRNLRRPLRMAAPVLPSVASGLGDHLRQAKEYREQADNAIERADRALAKAAAAA